MKTVTEADAVKLLINYCSLSASLFFISHFRNVVETNLKKYFMKKKKSSNDTSYSPVWLRTTKAKKISEV